MRLEITHRADLAVRALIALNRRPDRLTPDRFKSADLAAALGTTTGFVPQVMGPLVKAEWVRSLPGPTGGYEGVVALDQLNVLQVVELVDGPTDTGLCVVADRPCDASESCALHVAWAAARRELRSSLSNLSLSNLSPDAMVPG